jgi:dienelactone hydrolase
VPTNLVLEDGEDIPSVLTLPKSRAPIAAALLLHGFSSRKEQMAESMGRALERHGVASLAIDLPLHGAREQGVEGLSLRSPVALVQKWRLAVREGHQALQFLAEHRAVDARRIGIVGYSLGAYLAVTIAASNPQVRAIVLAAGGDLPERTPFASLVRTIADPIRSVRALGGRPLLMVNGRFDRTILPSQANALFEAARDPKELRWYQGGHWLPARAIEDAAEWLANRLGQTNAHARPA